LEKLLKADNVEDFVALFQKKEMKETFIKRAENHYSDSGSYFEARKEIQNIDQSPLIVLGVLKDKLIQEAKDFYLDDVVKELRGIEYDPELLSKMPEFVASGGDELEMELHVEQEEENEEEQEFELEAQQEFEHVRVEQKTMATYPPREDSDEKYSVSERINTAYSDKIHVSEQFLPFSRLGTGSLHERKPFDESMYRVGRVAFTLNEAGHIANTVILDPLVDFKHGNMWYDIRTNRIIDKNNEISEEKINEILNSEEFLNIIAQIKFFDGRVSGYSQVELEALKHWLKNSDHKVMEKHFFDQILQHRPKERQAYLGSQLQKVFNELK